MKKHLSTWILAIVFLTGLSVLLYPTVSDYVNSKHQSKAIAEYVESMSHVDPEQYSAELEEAHAYNRALMSNATRFSPTEEELKAYHKMLGAHNNAIGYVEIPSIGVDLPMYLGAEDAVLQVGIGTFPGSSLPVGGTGTHAVLTGHRGLPSSRLLTDLDRVVEGDVFSVFVLNEMLSYEVDQIRIVLPTELDDLAIDPDKDYCTLVTCTPYGINTHRLLVRGHRIENAVADAMTARVTADAILVDARIVTPIVALPMVLAIVVILMLQGKHGSKKNHKSDTHK